MVLKYIAVVCIFCISHLSLRLLAVLSLISCSSRKEKLGSKTPINFTTSSVLSSEEEELSEASWSSSGLSESSGVNTCQHTAHNSVKLTIKQREQCICREQ